MNPLVQGLSHSDLVAIDTETNITETLKDRFCVGISVATSEEDFFYIPLGHKEDLFGPQNFKGMLPTDLFSDITGVVVFHNAKFDLHVLRQVGLEVPTGNLYDTMLMSHYINEYPPHGLKELAKDLLGFEESKDLQQKVKTAGGFFGYEAVPTVLMAPYAAQDVHFTRELFKYLWEDFQDYKELWPVDRELMLTLLRIEETGLLVDLEMARSLSSRAADRMHQIRQQLGFDPAKTKLLASKLFGPPPDGLGLIPSQFSPKTGKPQATDAFLASVGHPTTALIREYRGLSKAKSSYFDAYDRLSTSEGRLHSNFKQHGTLTGRLSCEAPNLQQIPRENDDELKAAKKLFRAESNSELWEFDYRNIEYRLAAVYGRVPELLDGFRHERDIHSEVAAELGIPRYQAKVTVFLVLYGGGVNKLKAQLNCSYRDAEDVLNRLRSRYPGLNFAAKRCEEIANDRGYVKMWTGRRRHMKYENEGYKAFNSVLQGGAFEIVKRGLINVNRAGFDVRNQVHDSIWVNLPVGEVDVAVKEITKLMVDWTEPVFDLPFTIDAKRLN